jgi:hypothetical protein
LNSALNVIAKVEDPEYQKLTLRLMDDKSVGVAECIGAAELPIKEVYFQHSETFPTFVLPITAF